MNCPYFRESYFGICVAPDSVHIPSIDEMERLCFRSSYVNCPSLLSVKGSGPQMPYQEQERELINETVQSLHDKLTGIAVRKGR